MGGVPWENYVTDITRVVVGNGVTTIGGRAFRDCENLTDVNMADSVTIIGYEAFKNCYSIVSLHLRCQKCWKCRRQPIRRSRTCICPSRK